MSLQVRTSFGFYDDSFWFLLSYIGNKMHFLDWVHESGSKYLKVSCACQHLSNTVVGTHFYFFFL